MLPTITPDSSETLSSFGRELLKNFSGQEVDVRSLKSIVELLKFSESSPVNDILSDEKRTVLLELARQARERERDANEKNMQD